MVRVAARRFAVRPRLIRWLGRATPLSLVAVVLIGCGVRIPADQRTSLVAGVVEGSTRQPDGSVTYDLESGDVAEIASQKQVLLGGEPLGGELLLAGIDPDGRQWVAGVSLGALGRPEGCFWLPSQGRLAGEWIETTTGFRFRKAPGFVDGDVFTSDRGGFCLNDGGEVTSYDLA